MKLVKSPAELAYIRRAAGIADAAMEVLGDTLAEGRTELYCAGKVYDAMLSAGSGIAASPINLVSDARSAFRHGAPTYRALRRGPAVNVEDGPPHPRYPQPLQRQFP